MPASIVLACGTLTAKVDTDVQDRLAAFSWRAQRACQTGERFYAYAYAGNRKIYMHRCVLGVPPDLTVDHVDGDGLNNQRSNLRPATRSQNNANRLSCGSSGYRGVESRNGTFRASIAEVPERRHVRRFIRLGIFETAEEAARAYDQAASARWGEFARLNFPQRDIAATGASE
jgi:hypothetical protein